MNNHVETIHSDEIDLKEFLSILWRKKIYILFFSILFVSFGSLYLHSAERKYTIEYKMKPVSENKKNTSLSGLGGFASIAGIQLPSNTTNDFMIFKELIFSIEVSEKILKNKELTQKIYAKEWNSDLESFSAPEKSKTKTYLEAIKNILTGNKEENYKPPNARRLAEYIYSSIDLIEDSKTSFLTITSETSDPELLLSLILEVTRASDEIMRQRYINFSKEPLEFYKEKIRSSRSREHREALASLIGEEEQKLMFASRGKHFIAEPYLNPTISLYPTSPNSKIVLALSLFFGLLIGSIIVFFQNEIVKVNK